MITALAGGVGAARFLQGLVHVVAPQEITVIVNTGDDIELHGLYISPDIDIVTYTLAGIVDETKGWGVKEDTFHSLEMLGRYGRETWFMLGDRDLATHIHRTQLLRQGWSLSQVTESIRHAYNLNVRILPMSDQPITTMISTDQGVIHFQEYLIQRKMQDLVKGVQFRGAEHAEPAPGVLEAILKAEGVILCPSNPLVSIGSILALEGVREALQKTTATVAAISPIVGGAPIKGPADRLMRGLGLEVSAYQIAALYRDFLDVFIMDQVDSDLVPRIRSLKTHPEHPIRVVTTNTIMRRLKEKIELARVVMQELI
jgi:LPPG:FO 2-phospho-L-lactate transferase